MNDWDLGLTAEEARQAAGLSLTSCYWKRCSELRQMNLTRDSGLTREGGAGHPQGISVVTSEGVRLARMLQEDGWALFPPTPPAARNGDPGTSQAAARSKARRVSANRQQGQLLLAYYRKWMRGMS